MKGIDMWIDDLTDGEREVLRVAEIEGEYTGPFGFSYEIAIYNYAELSVNGMKGALSSLVKKGILNHRRIKEDGQWWNYYSVTSEEKANELREYFKEKENNKKIDADEC